MDVTTRLRAEWSVWFELRYAVTAFVVGIPFILLISLVDYGLKGLFRVPPWFIPPLGASSILVAYILRSQLRRGTRPVLPVACLGYLLGLTLFWPVVFVGGVLFNGFAADIAGAALSFLGILLATLVVGLALSPFGVLYSCLVVVILRGVSGNRGAPAPHDG